MIVLIDTDILIDLALERKPYAESAGRLLDALQNRPGTAFIAWHTVSNFYYLVVPTQGRESCKAFLSDLVRFVDVAPTTTDRCEARYEGFRGRYAGRRRDRVTC